MGSIRPYLTPFPEHQPGEGERFDQRDEPWLIPDQADPGRPMTPIQALMEAPPHEEPETSQIELLALRDILADALADLEPRDKRLIEARIIERRSLRSLEKELGWRKSHMQRRERVLLAELAEKLSSIPAIQEYLHRHD